MSTEDDEDLALIQAIRDRGEVWIPGDEAMALMDQWLAEADQNAQQGEASQPAGDAQRREQAESAPPRRPDTVGATNSLEPDRPIQADSDGIHES